MEYTAASMVEPGVPISDLISPAALRVAELTRIRRGYDPDQVRALLSAAADALQKAHREVETARTISTEVTRLNKEIEVVHGELSTARAEIARLGGERERLALAKPPAATEGELMTVVGDTVGRLLREAVATAEQLGEQAQREINELEFRARTQAEGNISEAEERALSLRRDAQTEADTLLADVRRAAEALRRETVEAGALARLEAERAADEWRAAADAYRDEAQRRADEHERTTYEAAERDAKRMLVEAAATAEGKVRAADSKAGETIAAAQRRSRELDAELKQRRERELSAIGQMQAAREALTQRLSETRSGLEDVLRDVIEDQVKILGTNAEPKAPAEPADGLAPQAPKKPARKHVASGPES